MMSAPHEHSHGNMPCKRERWMEHTKLNESTILARRHSHVDQLAERHEVTGVTIKEDKTYPSVRSKQCRRHQAT